MFFSPLWLYLKALGVTLFVEVGLFTIFISKKPIKILSSASFNLLSHLLLHLFFYYLIVFGIGYGFWIWFIGEILVLALEGFLYYISKIIPDIRKAYIWAFVFNISSIIVGQIINLFL